ncbi:hypothetical protein GCM10028784_39110 [Myceligenerans cantabricum]
MALRVGIKLTQNVGVDDLVAFWRLADQAEFHSVWNMDHLMAFGPGESGTIFDAWAMLAAMARETSRVRIGCMVSGNTYRHPGMLAKLAVTVDHLSDGRLEFGIGAGWNEREHEMFGLELPPVRERMDRWEESLRVIRSLWSEERTTLDGEHYQVRDAVAEPKPVQRPHPPIWIGGAGRNGLFASQPSMRTRGTALGSRPRGLQNSRPSSTPTAWRWTVIRGRFGGRCRFAPIVSPAGRASSRSLRGTHWRVRTKSSWCWRLKSGELLSTEWLACWTA